MSTLFCCFYHGALIADRVSLYIRINWKKGNENHSLRKANSTRKSIRHSFIGVSVLFVSKTLRLLPWIWHVHILLFCKSDDISLLLFFFCFGMQQSGLRGRIEKIEVVFFFVDWNLQERKIVNCITVIHNYIESHKPQFRSNQLCSTHMKSILFAIENYGIALVSKWKQFHTIAPTDRPTGLEFWANSHAIPSSIVPSSCNLWEFSYFLRHAMLIGKW